MHSLIKTDDQQLKLFGSDQMDPALFSAEESGATPEFTGARLFAHAQETYRAIVALSAEGLGAIRIGKILHVSPNTVLSVRAREPESIDIEKRRLSTLSREAARMCVEGIIEMLSDPVQVKKMSIKDKGIVFGILSEKSELLSGSPTARLQTIGAPPAVEVVEYLRWLRSEYARRTGLGEGKREEKGECQALPAPEIIEPGASCEAGPVPERVPAAESGPETGIGQTPHRSDDMPVNIESNDGMGLGAEAPKHGEVATPSGVTPYENPK